MIYFIEARPVDDPSNREWRRASYPYLDKTAAEEDCAIAQSIAERFSGWKIEVRVVDITEEPV